MNTNECLNEHPAMWVAAGRRPSESGLSDDVSEPTSPQHFPDTASDGAASHVSAFDPYTWRDRGENNRLHTMLEDRRQEVTLAPRCANARVP